MRATVGPSAALMLMAFLLGARGGHAQVRVSVDLLYPVESVFLSDFAPYNVGQQPDFLSVTLQNGAVGSQTVVLELSVVRERPSAALLFRGTTDPFELRGPIRRLTNRDLSTSGRDVSMTSYEIGGEVDGPSRQAARTGRFPAGAYVVTVRLITPQGLLLDEDELRLELVNPSRLDLIAPGAPFSDPPPIVTNPTPRFLWAPDEGLAGASEYRIRVVRADGAASGEEAMQGFASWEGVARTPSALYPGSVSALPLEPGGTYAWQVTRRVRTSGGVESIESPIFWFRVAPRSTASAHGGPAADEPAALLLERLARLLGLSDDLAGFRPTGQVFVDGVAVPVDGLEDLVRAILAGEVAVRSIVLR